MHVIRANRISDIIIMMNDVVRMEIIPDYLRRDIWCTLDLISQNNSDENERDLVEKILETMSETIIKTIFEPDECLAPLDRLLSMAIAYMHIIYEIRKDMEI